MVTSLLCACQSTSYPSIPNEIEVVADSILIDHNIYASNRMFIVGNKVVVYERNAERVFSVFELPSFKFLYDFGEKGHGPNELLSIENSFHEQNNGFRLFEIETNKVRDVALNDRNASLDSSYALKVNKIGLNRFVFLRDKENVYLSDDEKYEYCLLQKDGKEKYFGNYPENLLPEKDGEPKFFIYNKHTAGKPDGRMFVAFYAYIRMCRIFDNAGNMLHENLLELPEKTEEEHKTIEYPEPPYVTNENIYIIHKTNGYDELEIWNWEGKLLALYHLDKRLKTITVADNTLYGFSQDNPCVVYKYNLPR